MKNNKALGQHWLKDRAILDAIADLATGTGEPEGAICGVSAGYGRGEAAEPRNDGREDRAPQIDPSGSSATVLEIGPGLGTLTSSLLKRFQKVIAVEYDPRLAANLPKSFPGTNLTVVYQDILKFDFSTLPPDYVVVGNIPYYITSPIITKLLSATPRPARIVLLIQKEVADRILAEPRRHTYLSINVQSRATVQPGFIVPRDFFTPPPKVDSAVIILTPRPTPLLSPSALNLAKQGFSSPRKKLIKNLPYDKSTLEPIFAKLHLDLNARPADLEHQDWKNLANLLDNC